MPTHYDPHCVSIETVQEVCQIDNVVCIAFSTAMITTVVACNVETQ